jgi:hypothetical protein
MGTTGGARTAYPSGAPPVFSGFLVARSSVFCVVFCRSFVVLFIFLAIVLSVLLRITDSDYPFGIQVFKICEPSLIEIGVELLDRVNFCKNAAVLTIWRISLFNNAGYRGQKSVLSAIILQEIIQEPLPSGYAEISSMSSEYNIVEIILICIFLIEFSKTHFGFSNYPNISNIHSKLLFTYSFLDFYQLCK